MFQFQKIFSVTWKNLLVLNYEKKTSQKHQKISQKRKGSDSPGSFGFERTRKINSRIIPPR